MNPFPLSWSSSTAFFPGSLNMRSIHRKPFRFFQRLWIGAVFLGLALFATAAPLRVATFNVKGGLGNPSGTDFQNVAAVLQRIDADVVGLQELQNDSANLASLSQSLGLPHRVSPGFSSMQVGLLSRHPVSGLFWIDDPGMTRPILLAQIDVPEAIRKPWVAVVHLKCCDTNGSEQYTRAVELYYLRQALRTRVASLEPVVLMGDFNMVSRVDRIFDTGPGGISPFPAPADADGYFLDVEIFKLDARHAGSGGETWTWRTNGQYPSSALDHIMVNTPVRRRGPAVEIYNAEKDAAGIVGLPKFGNPLPAALQYASDHLPVFADLDLVEDPFVMDGTADSSSYVIHGGGLTLHAAVRGTRLYVATRSTGNRTQGNDHHIFVADALLPNATSPAPWAKRGLVALPSEKPFLAAEGVNDYAGWFKSRDRLRLKKSPTDAGVLEGSLDLLEEFGAVPGVIHIAAVAYETTDASSSNPLAGRVLAQVPSAVVPDDNITPDEFFSIPLALITDSAGNGIFDIGDAGRGFAAELAPQNGGFDLRWKSIPGRVYRIWNCAKLGAEPWTLLQTVVAGEREWEKSVRVHASGGGQPAAFFRIELVEPSMQR